MAGDTGVWLSGHFADQFDLATRSQVSQVSRAFVVSLFSKRHKRHVSCAHLAGIIWHETCRLEPSRALGLVLRPRPRNASVPPRR